MKRIVSIVALCMVLAMFTACAKLPTSAPAPAAATSEPKVDVTTTDAPTAPAASADVPAVTEPSTETPAEPSAEPPAMTYANITMYVKGEAKNTVAVTDKAGLDAIEKMIMSVMVRSAAWEAPDLSTIDGYVEIACDHAGEENKYYAYVMDGVAVFQTGKYYFMFMDEDVKALCQLAPDAVRFVETDGIYGIAHVLRAIAKNPFEGTAGSALKEIRYAAQLLDKNADGKLNVADIRDAAKEAYAELAPEAKAVFKQQLDAIYTMAKSLTTTEAASMLESAGYVPKNASAFALDLVENMFGAIYEGAGLEKPAE